MVYARRNLDKIIIMSILEFEMLGVYALALQVYFIMMVFASISSKFLVFSNASRINSSKARSSFSNKLFFNLLIKFLLNQFF